MKDKHYLRIVLLKKGRRKLLWSLITTPPHYERLPKTIPITKGMYDFLMKVMEWEENYYESKKISK